MSVNKADDPTFIDCEKLKRMQSLHVNFLIFDTRTAEDYSKDHIKGALHIEAKDFLEKFPKMVPSKDTPVVLYDVAGKSITELVREAEKLNYLNIVILEGGFEAYIGLTKIS